MYSINSKPAVNRQPGFRRGARRAGYFNLGKIQISTIFRHENSHAIIPNDGMHKHFSKIAILNTLDLLPASISK